MLFSLDAAALLLRVGFGLTLALVHGLNKLKEPARFIENVAKRFPAPAVFGGPGRHSLDALIAGRRRC